MYSGIRPDAPAVKHLHTIELGSVKTTPQTMETLDQTIQSEAGLKGDLRSLSLHWPLAFALENIVNHGSDSCSIIVGENDDGQICIEVHDADGGFDPTTIENYKIHGFGLKHYKSTYADVSHSPDGKSTYLLEPE